MLVSWEGFEEKDSTREPVENLPTEMVEAFRDHGKKQTRQKQTTNSLNDLLLKVIDWRSKFSTKSKTERGTFAKKDVEDLSWKNYVRCFFTHVMELTQLLAKVELKCNIKYALDKDDILKRIGVACKERREWLEGLREKEDGLREITSLTEIIAYAQQGDVETMDILNLWRLPTLKMKKIKNIPGNTSLGADFKTATEVAAFGPVDVDDPGPSKKSTRS